MDFQSVLVEIAEAFVAENYRSQLPQGILLNQASISGALPPPPSAGSSVATLHELTSSATEQRQEALSSASDVGGDADQASSGSARRSPSEGANSASASTGGTGGTSVGTNHGGASGGDFRNATAKQIGVSIQSLAAAENSGYLATMLHGLLQERPATGGEGNAIAVQNSKSIPVHCLVEQGCGQATEPTVNNDCYAIIPSCTLFSDLVRTALINLGYSANEVIGARGAIQIKNWRPLTFDQITENAEATVGDILGELATIAMLRIRLYRNQPEDVEWNDAGVRSAVLQLLREMSQSKLAKLCPMSQPLISNIVNNRHGGKLGKEKCVEFGAWFAKYRADNPGPCISGTSEKPQDGRLTFHAVHELPKLKEWFRENNNPSIKTLETYAGEINAGHIRQQDRPKVTVGTLKNWWKNERQRSKKHGLKHRLSNETSSHSNSQEYECEEQSELNLNKRQRLTSLITTEDDDQEENIDCPKHYLNL